MRRGRAKYTDSEVIKLAEEADALKVRIERLSMKMSEKKAEVLNELQRRGTKAIENSGRRVTFVQSETVVYNDDQLLARLTPSQRKVVTVPRMDKGLLLAAVQSGRVPATLVDECSDVRVNAPYYRLTNATGKEV